MKNFTLAMLVLLAASCSTTPEQEEEKSQTAAVPTVRTPAVAAKDYYGFIETEKPKAQEFEINPTEENIIKGEKGTVLYLPKNCIELDGADPKTVEITMSEFADAKDFFTEDLTTTAGPRLLESNGMVNIECRAGSEKLKLKKDARAAVFFPETEKKGMKLFYGSGKSEGSIDWELQDPEEDVVRVNIPEEIEESPKYFSASYELPNNIRYNLVYTENGETKSVAEKFEEEFIPSEKLIEYLNKNHRGFILRYKFDLLRKDGKITNVRPSLSNSAGIFDREIIETLSEFPPPKLVQSTKPIETLSESYVLEFKLTEETIANAIVEQQRQDSIAEVKRSMNVFRSFSETASAQLDSADQQKLGFTFRKFGWINCDQFIRNDNPIIVSTPINDASGRVFLVAENSMFNGISTYDSLIFEKVPNSSKMLLLISQVQGDSVRLYTKALRTGTENLTLTLDDFDQVTVEELDQLLDNLDSENDEEMIVSEFESEEDFARIQSDFFLFQSLKFNQLEIIRAATKPPSVAESAERFESSSPVSLSARYSV